MIGGVVLRCIQISVPNGMVGRIFGLGGSRINQICVRVHVLYVYSSYGKFLWV